MELDHLHVADLGAGAIGHRDAVAGRDIGIGRKLVDLTGTAGRQYHRGGRERLDASGLGVQDVQTKHSVLGRSDRTKSQLRPRDEVDRQVVLQHLDLGRAGDGAEQRGFDGAAGHVAGVEDTALGVAAFAAEVWPAIGSVLELHAPRDEFGDPGGAGFDDVADRREVAESVAGGERILDVAGEVVGLVGDAGDAALRPVGVRFGAGLLRHDGDRMTAFGQIEREAQPSDAAADDDCLEMGRH